MVFDQVSNRWVRDTSIDHRATWCGVNSTGSRPNLSFASVANTCSLVSTPPGAGVVVSPSSRSTARAARVSRSSNRNSCWEAAKASRSIGNGSKFDSRFPVRCSSTPAGSSDASRSVRITTQSTSRRLVIASRIARTLGAVRTRIRCPSTENSPSPDHWGYGCHSNHTSGVILDPQIADQTADRCEVRFGQSSRSCHGCSGVIVTVYLVPRLFRRSSVRRCSTTL